METPEEQIESLARKIEQREKLTRRRAWLITLIPVIFAGLFLTYTIWQIAQAEQKLCCVFRFCTWILILADAVNAWLLRWHDRNLRTYLE